MRAAYVACAFSKARALEVIPRSTQIATAPPLSPSSTFSLSLSLSFFSPPPRRWLTSRELYTRRLFQKAAPVIEFGKYLSVILDETVKSRIRPVHLRELVSARRFFSFSLRSSNTLLPVYSITETPSLSLCLSIFLSGRKSTNRGQAIQPSDDGGLRDAGSKTPFRAPSTAESTFTAFALLERRFSVYTHTHTHVPCTHVHACLSLSYFYRNTPGAR